jgi:hypothetical protein
MSVVATLRGAAGGAGVGAGATEGWQPMGSLQKRLQAMEMELVDSLIVGALVRAEIQEMLAVLEASDDIEPPLYEKVARIVEGAGNDAG